MAASPSSSPRLPSPPPIAEDQLGPKSPTSATPNEHGILGPSGFEEGAARRIRPGTKAADMPEGPPLVPLKNIETAFQLTEHLKALYNDAIHPDGASTVVPLDRATAARLAQPPDGVDKSMWLYELCRFLVQNTNSILIGLLSDNPPCSNLTCTEMRASEWQYLCAVHDPPKPCCAIDYCCHTLDWAASTLTSTKNFPSRLSFGAENGSSTQQMRQLTNIFRRVYRIFAHAWFQHRDVFWDVESKGGLYIFFKTVCDTFNLIQPENYTIPLDAEGIESIPMVSKQPQPVIWSRAAAEKEASGTDKGSLAAGKLAPGSGHPTQRHRQSPSMSASSISPLAEVPEEDSEKSTNQGAGLGLSNNEAEVPEKVTETSDEEEAIVTLEDGPEKTAEEATESIEKSAIPISPESSEADSQEEPIFTPPSSEGEKEHATDTLAEPDIAEIEQTTDGTSTDHSMESTEPEPLKEVPEPATEVAEPITEVAEPMEKAESAAEEKPEETIPDKVRENTTETTEPVALEEDMKTTDADVDEPAGETSESSDTTSLSASTDPSSSDLLTESQSTLDSTPPETEHPSKEPEADKRPVSPSETSAVPPKKSTEAEATEELDQEGVKRSDTAVKKTETAPDRIVASDPKADAKKDEDEATKSVDD